MPFPHHPGVGLDVAGGIFTDIVAALFFLICFVIVVAVLVVLVRFLLVATRAAELYVTRNGGTLPKWYWGSAGGPSTSSGTVSSPETVTSPESGPSTSSGTVIAPTATKPVTRTPRTPKPSA